MSYTGADWGQSGRKDGYQFRCVDPFSLQETGEYVEVEYGKSKVNFDYGSKNGVSASLAVVGTVPGCKMVRVVHTISLPGRESPDVRNLCTLHLVTPKATARSHLTQRTYSAYGPLYALNGAVLKQDFSRPAGYPIVSELREIFTSFNVPYRISPELDEDRRHTVSVFFSAGTNLGDMLRQLATWTGWELGFDELGYVTFGPYTAPTNKGSSYAFEDGAWSVYEPDITYSDNAEDAVNYVVARWERNSIPTNSDGTAKDEYGTSDSAVAELPDWASFSHAKLGRWKGKTVKVQEPCSHADLLAIAERSLNEYAFLDYYELQGPSVPVLRSGDTATYHNTHDHSKDITLKGQVTQMAMTLGRGCITKTKLDVVSYG